MTGVLLLLGMLYLGVTGGDSTIGNALSGCDWR